MILRKTIVIGVLFLILFIILVPLATAGDFSLTIHSPEEVAIPDEYLEINGTHQLIPSLIDRILPKLWASQYSIIEIADKPDWLSVSITESTLITPPDGKEYSFKIVVATSEDAPMNTSGTVKLSIVTGKFARTIPWIPGLIFGLDDEFEMDQSFQFRTGNWEKENNNNKEDTKGEQGDEEESNDDLSSQSDQNKGGMDICFLSFIILLILLTVLIVYRLLGKKS